MIEPTPTNPSPTAVPWTPDMMAPQNPPTAQPQFQAQAYQAQQPQPVPMQSQPQQPQPQAMAQAYPAPSQHAAPQHMPQAVTPPHAPQAFAPQTQHQAAQFAAPHPHHAQMAATQQPHPQTAQPNYAQPHLSQPQTSQHFTQAGPPPLAPHMRGPVTLPDQTPATEPESKSLFAKLLKRSPKPSETQSETPALPANSDSLFNKNFALGALTGLVIGSFVLPMALNMFSSEVPVQVQAQVAPPAGFEAMPTAVEGDTFIDEAIAADAP